jgi:ABC-type glutathione transport system ATPase component
VTADERPLVEVRDLRVEFRHGHHGRPVRAVDGVDLDVRAGEMFGLVGESGSGKSTIARCIVGLQAPTSGAVCFRGKAMPGKRSIEDRRAIQMVFQDPFASLNPALRMRAVLEELLTAHGIVPRSGVEARCRQLFASVGLSPDLLDSYPRGLSGGQRQRASIARALAVEPAVLLADEVTSALDVSVQAAVLNLLLDLRERFNLTVVLISHNLAVVRHVCDRVAVMHRGRIVEQGTSDDLFANPHEPYTKRLIAAVPSLGAEV